MTIGLHNGLLLLPAVVVKCMQTFFNKNRVVLLHISFWLVYLSFNLYQASVFQRGRGYDWGNMLTSLSVQLLFTMMIAYLNYFFTWPRFLKSKNVWRYILEFSVPFSLLVIIRVHLQRFIVDGYTHEVKFFYSSFFIVQVVAITLFIVFFVGMLRFAVDWFELEGKEQYHQPG